MKYTILNWLNRKGWAVTLEGDQMQWRDIRPYRTVVHVHRYYPACERPHIDNLDQFDAAFTVEFDRRIRGMRDEFDAKRIESEAEVAKSS